MGLGIIDSDANPTIFLPNSDGCAMIRTSAINAFALVALTYNTAAVAQHCSGAEIVRNTALLNRFARELNDLNKQGHAYIAKRDYRGLCRLHRDVRIPIFERQVHAMRTWCDRRPAASGERHLQELKRSTDNICKMAAQQPATPRPAAKLRTN
jgi:hypothetical protein